MKNAILALPVVCALFLGALSAQADVVVGVHKPKYGSVIVVGHPNSEAQSDTTFSMSLNTVGSRSEDSGQIDYQPINKKIRLRTGQYTAFYSNTASTFEVSADETTVIRLQKVTASALPNTVTVALVVPRTPDDYDSSVWTTIGSWQRVTEGPYKGPKKDCTTSFSGWPIPLPRESCASDYLSTPIYHSWKEAYFYVLPGTYTMLWTFVDGTTHQENSIVVQ